MRQPSRLCQLQPAEPHAAAASLQLPGSPGLLPAGTAPKGALRVPALPAVRAIPTTSGGKPQIGRHTRAPYSLPRSNLNSRIASAARRGMRPVAKVAPPRLRYALWPLPIHPNSTCPRVLDPFTPTRTCLFQGPCAASSHHSALLLLLPALPPYRRLAHMPSSRHTEESPYACSARATCLLPQAHVKTTATSPARLLQCQVHAASQRVACLRMSEQCQSSECGSSLPSCHAWCSCARQRSTNSAVMFMYRHSSRPGTAPYDW